MKFSSSFDKTQPHWPYRYQCMIHSNGKKQWRVIVFVEIVFLTTIKIWIWITLFSCYG